MAMFRAVYTAMKVAFGAAISQDECTKFVAMTPEEQLAIITEIVDENREVPALFKVTDQQARIFVLLFRLKMGLTPGSPEHLALKDKLQIPAPTGWKKTSPPTDMYEFSARRRQPCWVEEFDLMGTVPDMLDFASVVNDEDIINAIKTVLGIGGMEDLGDPRAIQADNPTMRLMVQAVKLNLPLARPDWVDLTTQKLFTTLPDGIENRARFIIDAEVEVVKKRDVVEAKRKADEERRQKAQKIYDASKAKIFEFMASQKDAVEAAIPAFLAMGFAAFKKLEADESKSWIPPTILKSVSDMATQQIQGIKPEDIAEKIQESVHLAGQFILVKMCEKEPSWFYVSPTGDQRIRRAQAKDPETPVVNRAHKACVNHCFELSRKYGTVELAKAVLAVFSINKKVEDVFGAVPEKPVNPLAQA